jgi:spore maturation protein CgeB
MRVLLYDTTLNYPVSPFFVEGLDCLKRQRGYEYELVDEDKFLSPLRTSFIWKVAYRILGRRPLSYWALNRTLLEAARRFRPDIVLVSGGAFISANTLKYIKQETWATLINYATDDPFRRAMSTGRLRDSVALYDIYACTKKGVMEDVKEAGCKKVIYIRFAYQPAGHFPEKPKTSEEKARFGSDVAFVGGCDGDRVPFFETLIRAVPSVRLNLYGGYWNRHRLLRRYHRGCAFGREYRLTLGGTKIAVNLVRRSNRDDHVMRTFEIPACGAFMLAERTDAHMELFEEDREAAFFGSAEELAEKVKYYLAHEAARQRIAEAGYRRVTSDGNRYSDRLLEILRAAALV